MPGRSYLVTDEVGFLKSLLSEDEVNRTLVSFNLLSTYLEGPVTEAIGSLEGGDDIKIPEKDAPDPTKRAKLEEAFKGLVNGRDGSAAKKVRAFFTAISDMHEDIALEGDLKVNPEQIMSHFTTGVFFRNLNVITPLQ